MARLQILELPEGSGDDRPPFVLVIDQCQGVPLDMVETVESSWRRAGEEIGARGVLIFVETVDIPANGTPVEPPMVHVEGDLSRVREVVLDEIQKAQRLARMEGRWPR
ncbi:hypothetical protein ABZ876_08500 [Streptomyces sp. NPDC046931]|uniref:hypothetical protein n=1 Tax=Streptomyces sp. NPDC046931 TaxID=3154806 RepID=UPI0033D544A8